MKQRENLGTLNEDPRQSTRSLTISKKKDMSQKEIDAIEKEMAAAKRLEKLRVQKKEVRKKLDVSIVSADTMEALMRFLGIEAGDFDRTLNRKLTLNSARKTTVKKAPESPRPGGVTPVLETENESDDFMRN